MSDDKDTVPPRRSRGVGTGVMNKALDIIASDKESDKQVSAATIEALQSTNTKLIYALVASMGLIAMIIAGILGVGVTGKIPGVGDIAIESSD